MPKILVIDDDELMRKTIRKILDKDGLEVVTAKDGKEAFEILGRETFDIVVTDLMMPFANGLDVVNKVRNDEMKRSIGIIVLSSIDNKETVTEAFRLGADDFLKKPVMADELLSSIRKLLANMSSKPFITKKK